MSKMFGAELRGRRLAAGLSLTDLARQVHYSKGHLSRVETGHKPPGADLARRCDAVFQADGELAALAGSKPAEDAVPVDGDGEVWLMSLGPGGDSWFAPVSRREAMTTGAAALLGARLPEVVAQRESTVAVFEAMFVQYRRLGMVAGPSTVLPSVITQTHTLRELARATPGETGKRLTLLAARFAEYAGWMAQEAGDDRLAMWWTRASMKLAGHLGGADLAANGLIRQALVTLYRDDAVRTIDLARQAQANADASPRIHGLAALREAQGHALAGAYDDCRRALDRGRPLLAGADDTDGLSLGPASVTDFTEVITGWCLHDLGRPAEAAEVLDRALTAIPAGSHRPRARFGARRALAHAAAGEVEHACALTAGVLDEAALVDSATIRQDLRRISRTLARWHTHPPVRELQPRLAAALQAPLP
ncbi:helix-turn-helix domain-containing protein [Crossiella sp. SN42]|uniref:helix-turn-helix transcriptional regulator n=1 Tax=Crossiella sp. SN42 TaxID=2944808 RepID=UPI00207C1F2D|nr:helix-turn-helix transcriptional regulator [Crossiella sp. SN42]MCO1574583.1 helix-turn-helix domain-containing protein [Crossiella sp. SN42]